MLKSLTAFSVILLDTFMPGTEPSSNRSPPTGEGRASMFEKLTLSEGPSACEGGPDRALAARAGIRPDP
jgi:hypothetical protein